MSIASLGRGLMGILVLILIAYAFSNNQKDISWKTVVIGLLTQIIIAFGVINISWIKKFFEYISSFFINIFGLVSLILIRAPAPSEIGKKQSFPEQLKAISFFLREDTNFRFFFWARAVATMGKMTLPFYVLHAGQEVGFSGYFLGVLTSVFTPVSYTHLTLPTNREV